VLFFGTGKHLLFFFFQYTILSTKLITLTNVLLAEGGQAPNFRGPPLCRPRASQLVDAINSAALALMGDAAVANFPDVKFTLADVSIVSAGAVDACYALPAAPDLPGLSRLGAGARAGAFGARMSLPMAPLPLFV
jgi:hypothetical protein